MSSVDQSKSEQKINMTSMKTKKLVKRKTKSNYIKRIVLSRAAMMIFESLRIYESKQRGSEEDNTTIREHRNTSSASAENVETKRSDGILI